MNKKLALFLCVFLQLPVYGIIIQGDPASALGTNTFSFPLADAQYNQQNATMWTFNAIATTGTTRPFAISSIQDGATQAIAQTSTQATITTTGTPPIITTGANPLYGANFINFASLWTPSNAGSSALPVCVGSNLTTLYAFSNIIMADDTSSMYRFAAPGGKDIIGLQGLSGSIYYAASNSGTSVPNYIGFLVESTAAGNIKYLQEASNFTFDGGNLTPSGSSAYITISGQSPSLCLLGNNMYVGLAVQPATGVGGGGGVAVFLAALSGNTIAFKGIIPQTSYATNTVLSIDDAHTLTVYGMQIMNTSTGLTYLILNGAYTGVAGLYAVPIVTTGLSANYGKVAKYTNASHATDILVTSDPSTNMILSKGFQNPIDALTLSQIQTAGTPPDSLTVGGAFPAAATQITNLSVTGDTVYAATDVGTYFSKALFDQYGAIASWTPWQITHAATWSNNGQQASSAVDGNTGKGWFSITATLAATSIVQRTEWNNTSNPLLNVQNTISGNISGNLVQNIFDLSKTLPVFSGAPLSGIVYTGKNKVIAATTGQSVAGNYYPLNPATIAATTDATAIGHVVAFEIGVDTAVSPTVSWAFAAGQNGIGVSSTNAGRGGIIPDAGRTVANLFPNPFTLIANLPYVKKLQTATSSAPISYLYALNSQGLYRITLTSANFLASTTITPTPIFLASSLGPNVAFTDFIASTNNSVAVQFVVGTTQGLYVGQDGGSLTQVQLPSIQSVQKLIPQAALTATNNNLYVVAGDFANDQTEVVRFYLNNFGQVSVSASLIPFQDQTYLGVNKPFVTMYNFQNTFWWQGSCGLFGMSGRLGSLNPIVKILKSGVTGSMSSNQNIWMYLLNTLSIPGIASSTYLTTTLQDTAYGALQLGGGDFGLQVLS